MEGLSFGSFKVTKANWTASLGFGATALTGPDHVIDGLAKEAGAVKGEHDLYNIACNATIPSLFIGIGGYSFMIPPAELVRPLGTTDPACILNVRGGLPDFSIGAALGRQYCLTFDNDNVRFGYSANFYGLPVGFSRDKLL
ncbi:aspartyl protease-like protein [Aphelenchoides avenae]|nr:aspartyl protease-like protein [Aphelenchus avenae]